MSYFILLDYLCKLFSFQHENNRDTSYFFPSKSSKPKYVFYTCTPIWPVATVLANKVPKD